MELYREPWDFEGNNMHGRLPKTRKTVIYNGKNYCNIPKQLKSSNRFIALDF